MTILRLSAHPPHSVFVPCIIIEPGPKYTTQTPYKIVMLFKPEKSLKEVSFDNLYKIYSPTTINPKLLIVLIGSLNGPSLIRSHHLDASPITANESTDWIIWK